jgi:hypothetical protein
MYIILSGRLRHFPNFDSEKVAYETRMNKMPSFLSGYVLLASVV